jgi:hypothetical protein
MDEFDAHDGEWRHPDDELNVLRWRTERLMALGYDFRNAAFLASSGVDIHELERLIRKGCPQATAERIAA